MISEMDRNFYLDLAGRGLRMPIGTDLVLQEQADPEAIMEDGVRLGQVMHAAAVRYQTPLAIPLMDLRLEKADLLRALGVDESQCDAFQFDGPPDDAALETVRQALHAPFSKRNQAHIDSIRYIAAQTDLVPVGMAIGPFSLMTKLIADPITPIAMAGNGATADDDEGVRMVEKCLALAEMALHRSLAAQIEAGARAVLVCEPAANRVYISPKQIAAGANTFERFVMQPCLRMKAQLAAAGVDLIFHDCGELTDVMVREFATRLDPVILSLGSSRKLWDDAALVPKHVVLYGNLPTKNFYSDAAVPLEAVESMTLDLIARMKAAGHPHIVGSECDVLHVPDAAETIRRKVGVMMTCCGR
jgi:uroporphyrinogen-III decarboxylase